MSKAIGVIAEDRSDVAVVSVLLEKYAPKDKFVIRSFVGNGCGKLRSKCQVWADNLVQRGCEHVFLFHDLDRHTETDLRAGLVEKMKAKPRVKSLVVIPVEEIEAWLLSDEEALRCVFSLKQKPKKYKNCETVSSPKQELERLVWQSAKKRYLNTVHNVRIAERTSLDNLRRCPSFIPFDAYIKKNIFR